MISKAVSTTRTKGEGGFVLKLGLDASVHADGRVGVRGGCAAQPWQTTAPVVRPAPQFEHVVHVRADLADGEERHTRADQVGVCLLGRGGLRRPPSAIESRLNRHKIIAVPVKRFRFQLSRSAAHSLTLAVTMLKKKPPCVTALSATNSTPHAPPTNAANANARLNCSCASIHTNAASGAASAYDWRGENRSDEQATPAIKRGLKVLSGFAGRLANKDAQPTRVQCQRQQVNPRQRDDHSTTNGKKPKIWFRR